MTGPDSPNVEPSTAPIKQQRLKKRGLDAGELTLSSEKVTTRQSKRSRTEQETNVDGLRRSGRSRAESSSANTKTYDEAVAKSKCMLTISQYSQVD